MTITQSIYLLGATESGKGVRDGAGGGGGGSRQKRGGSRKWGRGVGIKKSIIRVGFSTTPSRLSLIGKRSIHTRTARRSNRAPSTRQCFMPIHSTRSKYIIHCTKHAAPISPTAVAYFTTARQQEAKLPRVVTRLA